jgi:nitroreductase
MSSGTQKSFGTCIDVPGRGMTIAAALELRRSIRAYLPEAPSLDTVRAVLEAARWSPSGSNMQPWKVIALAGSSRDEVCRLGHARAVETSEEGAYPILPPALRESHRARRSNAAELRLEAQGIARADAARREAAIMRNYDFFGAPVGLFFVVGREFVHSQWAHIGMFIQSVALAALELGLGTCTQEAWAKVRETLHRHFGLDPQDMIYCGMALGYPDCAAAVNRIRPARVAVDDFATFLGFEV